MAERVDDGRRMARLSSSASLLVRLEPQILNPKLARLRRQRLFLWVENLNPKLFVRLRSARARARAGARAGANDRNPSRSDTHAHPTPPPLLPPSGTHRF